MSPDQRVTAPQLNSFERTEHNIVKVSVAGHDISWMIELLEPFPGQVSFSFIRPVNSNLNTSMSTSGEGMELALTVLLMVHMRPTTWLAHPKIWVSFDNKESSEIT